ncbi:hypothetical protein ALNOE001_08460 [Candidatus Methanobinarius endosymbioticus]|uniref:Uncharacterized protein n=1 Tax=Candidatus Methanobinarius endosymbioticus TaxID=2006182 RepID=A0A366MBG7_9EURY|nr:hypothetical protein ALNOE001_08460 [Candidatus Methanobinarius endosymbioticus]
MRIIDNMTFNNKHVINIFNIYSTSLSLILFFVKLQLLMIIFLTNTLYIAPPRLADELFVNKELLISIFDAEYMLEIAPPPSSKSSTKTLLLINFELRIFTLLPKLEIAPPLYCCQKKCSQ